MGVAEPGCESGRGQEGGAELYSREQGKGRTLGEKNTGAGQ
jgi:hypothetical protein